MGAGVRRRGVPPRAPPRPCPSYSRDRCESHELRNMAGAVAEDGVAAIIEAAEATGLDPVYLAE
eukprot:4613861-Alexandrium_andersonii.AAC.1